MGYPKGFNGRSLTLVLWAMQDLFTKLATILMEVLSKDKINLYLLSHDPFYYPLLRIETYG